MSLTNAMVPPVIALVASGYLSSRKTYLLNTAFIVDTMIIIDRICPRSTYKSSKTFTQ